MGPLSNLLRHFRNQTNNPQVNQEKKQLIPVLIITLVVTGIIGGIREFGWMQFFELAVWDSMVRLSPDRGEDERLLIVEINENDIQAQRQWPLSDETIAQVLTNLQQHNPNVIGLDLYRDVVHQPGHEALVTALAADNVIAIENLINGIPAPPAVPPERIGFNDFVVDQDNVVRRNFMYTEIKDPAKTYYSFALRLTLAALDLDDPQVVANDRELRINGESLPILTPNAGSYHLDAGETVGWQILINYRSANRVAPVISITDILNNRVNPDLIKGKTILVGTTAPSQKDLFSTPHSATNSSTFQMSGVVLHAQMVSQLLDRLEGKRALFWHWPQSLEWVWFWVWAGVGALIARRWQNPWGLLGGLAIAVVSLWLTCFILFLNMGWIPFLPAAITTLLSGAAMLSYSVVYSDSHDRLTGLPNRSFLVKRLKAIAQKNNDKPFLAMMSLDIDRFKVINESFGHQAGDHLLKLTVGRIQHTLHEDYTLSRIGGDEFAILLENAINVGEVNKIADRLHQNLTLPVMLNQQEISTTVSIGIAISEPEEAIQADDLIRNAHTAMNRAKALGKDRHEIFSAGMRTQVINRLQLESDLRQAIKKQEFVLYYQPILDLKTETIIGFEALVRWQSPERGFVSPGEFIPLAEETGLIIPLGEWILKQACQQMHQWHQQFSREIPLIISVNLSIRQFSQPNLVEMVAQTIRETNLVPNSLKLEITESMVMDNVESAIEILESLKALNLRLSMDDFGTGYSSLSYLHRFPMDTIKVDQSFVRRIKDNGDDSEIARTVVMLGHNLGMDIIAEGIETVNQKQILQSLDCEYGQGYLFSKPVPVELVPDLLRKINFKDVKEMQS